MSLPAKREEVSKMLQASMISERRACALMCLARDGWRNKPMPLQADPEMSARIVALVHERRRFGYRRSGDLIRAQGAAVNDKWVYRLYTLQGLAVRKHRGTKRPRLEPQHLLAYAASQIRSPCAAAGRARTAKVGS